MPIHDWTRVDAGIFHHFHFYWVGAIASALNKGLLPSDCYALVEQLAGQTNGGTDSPRVRVSGRSDEDIYARKQRTIVVRHISDDRVLALVEVLSPGNKSSRDALRACLDKAVSSLGRGCQFLLVDLFPPGRLDPQGIHGALLREFADQSTFSLPPEKPLAVAAYTGGVE